MRLAKKAFWGSILLGASALAPTWGLNESGTSTQGTLKVFTCPTRAGTFSHSTGFMIWSPTAQQLQCKAICWWRAGLLLPTVHYLPAPGNTCSASGRYVSYR